MEASATMPKPGPLAAPPPAGRLYRAPTGPGSRITDLGRAERPRLRPGKFYHHEMTRQRGRLYTSPPWLSGRVVMQRPAKPCTPVRFRAQPPSPPFRTCPAFDHHAFLQAGTLPIPRAPGPGGEIGRRKGLKILRSDPCGFESRPGHHLKTMTYSRMGPSSPSGL